MEYTAAQKEEIQRTYAVRRQRQLAMTVPFLLVVIGFMFTNDQQGGPIMGVRSDVVTAIMVVFILLFVVLSFRNWRCPGCSKYLGRAFNPKFCQRCGVQLHD